MSAARRWISVLAVLASCSGGSGEETADPDRDPVTSATSASPASTTGSPTPPRAALDLPYEPDGPLRGLVMVAERDPTGRTLEPQLTFGVNDREATAIVGLGPDVADGATLRVEWFAVSAIDERRSLFSHEVAVRPNGLAFSRGVAPAGLQPGHYEVDATLADHLVSKPFRVVAPPAGFVARVRPRAEEDWETPSAGDSGWYEPNDEPLFDPHAGPCRPGLIAAQFSPLDEVYAFTGWTGACGPLEMSIGAAGDYVSALTTDVSEKEVTQESTRSLSVCELPGGSDLPGAPIKARAVFGPSTVEDVGTLPDHGQAVAAFLDTSPAPGTPVEAGETIHVQALGLLDRPALGLKDLVLRANGVEVQRVKNVSDADEPVACDPGRFYAPMVATYAVPADPPAVVELCVTATTFEGFTNDECVRFTTAGEAWRGELVMAFDGNVASAPDTPCDGTATFTFDLTVDGDHAVAGRGQITGEPFVCHTNGVDAPGPSPAGPMTLTGTKYDDRFELQLLPSPGVPCCAAWPGEPVGFVIVPIVAPDRAEVSFRTTNDVGQPWIGDLAITGTMTCTSCAS